MAMMAAAAQPQDHHWQAVDILGLSTFKRLSSAAIRRMVQRYRSLEQALAEHARELDVAGLPRQNIFGESAGQRIKQAAQRELERCAGAGVHVVSIIDADYPSSLKTIKHPPAILYVRGTLKSSQTGIALVGTRRCSPYGAAVTRNFAEEFSSAGCVVVSGLARGIDAQAHRATVQAGGITYAVIASGADCVSPAENVNLANDIVAAGGAILSEYPCGTRAVSAYFPRRNRIICGLAAAVIVTESALSGGAMISAQMTLDQGRPLFAVPGPINTPTSAGTNNLIRKAKACMVCSPHEVLNFLGRQPLHAFSRPAENASAQAKKSQRKNSMQPVRIPLLDRDEAAIHALLLRGASHIDDLHRESRQNLAKLMATLLRLESRGLVRALPGNRYAKPL